MTDSTRRFTLQVVALSVTVLLIFAGIYLWRSRSASGTPAFVPTPTVTYPSGQPDTAGLWIDGWSQKITSGVAVQVLDTQSPEPRTVTFTPATDEDVAALAKRSPAVLEQAAARMITADPKLSCGTDGCTTSTGNIPLSWFTHPDQIPDLGQVYQAWGITSVLFHTPIGVEDGDMISVEVSADGYDPYSFDIARPAPSQCDESGCGPATPPTTDLIMAASFGKLFSPWAAWTDEPASPFYPAQTVPADSSREVDMALLDPATGVTGLSDATEVTTRMGTSALTYFSSPTTGCPGFVCTPAHVDTVVDTNTLTQVPMCAAQGQDGFTTVVVQDLGVQVPFTQPTSQFGLGGGQTHTDGDYSWTSGSQPVSGPQTMRLVRYWLFDADDVPAHLSVTVAPTDPAAEFDPLLVSSIEAAAPNWMVCPTPEPTPTVEPTVAAPAPEPAVSVTPSPSTKEDRADDHTPD